MDSDYLEISTYANAIGLNISMVWDGNDVQYDIISQAKKY